MTLFAPATFSTDWEIMLFDRQDRIVSTDKVLGLAGILNAELGLPIQIDWNTVECAMGVNHSLAQIDGRIRKVTDRLSDLLGEYELDACPAASHPIEGMYNASHIHVGTVTSETRAIELETQLIPYVPVFAALAANSPLAGDRRGEFKSYRVRYRAHHCASPASVRDPMMAQDRWELVDAMPKLRGAATVEVRITDSASSRRFLAELATFVAAFLHTLGARPYTGTLTPAEYRDAMINRWSASRHGLQATFRWHGSDRPVVEILDEMLDDSREALAALGAARTDLALIEAMRRKRVCQADHVLSLAARYPDDYALASVYPKVLRTWDAFDGYLEGAAPLEPIAAPDDEALLQIHRDRIGESSTLYVTRDTMDLPPPVADAVLAQLIERGWVRRDDDPQRGTLLTRI